MNCDKMLHVYLNMLLVEKGQSIKSVGFSSVLYRLQVLHYWLCFCLYRECMCLCMQ